MKVFIRLLCCIFLLNLSGCVNQQKILATRNSVNQCQAICTQRFDACKMQCTNTCSRCSAASTHSSTVNYINYVHEKQIEGGIISRGLKSYRDPLQCRKVTCNCLADFMACDQGCTGVIQKRLQTVSYCT